MKKGVVILIIVGTLCYFGMRFYSKKYPDGALFSYLTSVGQWVSSGGNPESDVIYENDIILEINRPGQPPSQKSPFPPIPQGQGHVTKDLGQTIELARSYLQEGRKYEARNVLSYTYFAETNEARRKQIQETLEELNEELVFSPLPSEDADVYVVKKGDTLGKIAKRYNTSYELIMRINNKPNTRLDVKEKLKVLKGQVVLLVDKSDFTLTILLDGHYVKQFPIGTGVSGKTPVGTFKIREKLKDPTWYSPEGVYEHGHPKNILGTRWIGFMDKPGLSGYGIHGTKRPETIGEESSMGCIRMYNEDVTELYDFVIPGTEVIIQE